MKGCVGGVAIDENWRTSGAPGRRGRERPPQYLEAPRTFTRSICVGITCTGRLQPFTPVRNAALRLLRDIPATCAAICLDAIVPRLIRSNELECIHGS